MVDVITTAMTTALTPPSVQGPPRTGERRISRACDQCNQLRAKCDGRFPCLRCQKSSLACEYKRVRKKRGKASDKFIARQMRLKASGRDHDTQFMHYHDVDLHHTSGGSSHEEDCNLDVVTEDFHPTNFLNIDNVYIDPSFDTNGLQNMLLNQRDPSAMSGNSLEAYPGLTYDMMEVLSQGKSPPKQGLVSRTQDTAPAPVRILDSAGRGIPSGLSPGFSNFQPNASTQLGFQEQGSRYPVLNPLLPHLGNIISLSTAEGLLEYYFSSQSENDVRPLSPYILGTVFRKRAILHPTNPRAMRPVLLASILWVAAQTSDVACLTTPSAARNQVSHKLLKLITSLLNDTTTAGRASRGASSVQEQHHSADPDDMSSLEPTMPSSLASTADLTSCVPLSDSTRSIDHVITYIHLATVLSASESKGLSLLWWTAAWSLARKLTLNREASDTLSDADNVDFSNMRTNSDDDDEHDLLRNTCRLVTEEAKEERRRTWWLLYITDRHLALCYNRPICLLDTECMQLRLPIRDTDWQQGSFPAYLQTTNGTSPSLFPVMQSRFECSSHDVYGYFLPLMTILGEIVDIQHAKNHPWLGASTQPPNHWDASIAQVRQHLGIFQESLDRLEQEPVRSMHSPALHGMTSNDSSTFSHEDPTQHTRNPNLTNSHQAPTHVGQEELRTRLLIAYARHISHVLHILLQGRWDPINLLDDQDQWTNTEEFVTTANHAVAASVALEEILEYDPTLEFMPFFFGIYLLHGSFPLLLITSKLNLVSLAAISKACETAMRAHQACVVTLSTEYQRKFSKVLRSALSMVRGRWSAGVDAHCQFQRELLSQYRWTSDGSGLAI